MICSTILFGFLLVLVCGQDDSGKGSIRAAQRQVMTEGVISFELIDAAANRKLGDIRPNSVFYAKDMPNGASKLSVRAVTNPEPLPAGKVKLKVASYSRTEGAAPYALCGDRRGNFVSCAANVLPVNTPITVTATPTDSLLDALSVTFTVSTEDEQDPDPNEDPEEPNPSSCNVPQFVGGWQATKQLPYKVIESQGAFIGTDFLMVSGFFDGIDKCTSNVYSLDQSNSTAQWKKQDDFPIATGVSHGGFVVVDKKFYICGGYLGGHPGPSIDDCFVYDHSAKSGSQWSRLPSLPKKRSGGGLIFVETGNYLLYSAGAVRPDPNKPHAIDFDDTWILQLDNVKEGWKSKAKIPYLANHISYVTAYDDKGVAHHYFMGGQEGEKESSGNRKFLYEWLGDKWRRRTDMPTTRGHASSSTRAYGCGLIIVGGTSNEKGKMGDISYYDIPSGKWTKIGDLGDDQNTPVCDITKVKRVDWLVCRSPRNLSKKRKIVVPS